MTNYFYTYSIVWSIVLFAYLLGWSGLNKPLHTALLVFFIITIALSLSLGKLFSERFKYQEKKSPKKLPWFVVLGITGLGYAGIINLGFNPLGQIIIGTYDASRMYNSADSIIWTLGTVGCVFGSCYQISRLIEKPDVSDTIKLLLLLSALLIMANRGPLVVVCIVSLVLLVSKMGKERHFISIVLCIITIIGLLWLFGVHGNIRQGYSWNDSSYIYQLGYFEGRWPDWLPKQFCWSYSYLTSPLANLNYNLNYHIKYNIINYVYDFVPLFIGKRMPLYSVSGTKLQVDYFTVSSIWSYYYAHLDIIGLYLGYILQLLILTFWSKTADNTNNSNLMRAFCSECVIMSFFDNSLVYPTMSYPVFLLIIICVLQYGIVKYKNRSSIVPLLNNEIDESNSM